MTDQARDIITIRERVSGPEEARATVSLVWDLRQRSRFRARLQDGREVAVMLSREGVLRGGDRLRADSGLVVDVEAAPEDLVEARSEDALLLSRAAYHMGNRHVPLEVRPGCLRFQPDHVLEEMLIGLGMKLAECRAAFDPESGAYGAHRHGDAEGHGHSHAHSHGEDPPTPGEPDAKRGPRIHFMAQHAEGEEP